MDNILHATTSSGFDELRTVRVLVAQLLMLVLVTTLYIVRKNKAKIKVA